MLAELALLAAGCAHGPPPGPAAEAAPDRFSMPAPLAPRPFRVPGVRRGVLSNGLEVAVVENHEVPLVDVRVHLDAGGWTDPPDRAGLAGAAMDMLDEGTEGMDALELSRSLKAIAATLSTGAGADSAWVSVDVLHEHLGAALDLMSGVLLRPTFPGEEWRRVRTRRIQDIDRERSDPPLAARRVLRHVLYGDRYVGLLATRASLEAIDPGDMREWAGRWLVPSRAVVLAGGDVTLEELLPALEERLGSWSGPDPGIEPPAGGQPARATTLYLLDRPGAPQSVLRAACFAPGRSDPSWTALAVADRAFGGQFTSRLNLELRENKGYTYGARSSLSFHHDGRGDQSIWAMGSSVRTGVTVPALADMLRELAMAGGPPPPGTEVEPAPFSPQEIAYGASSMLHGFAARFERPGFQLSALAEARDFELPAGWLESTPERVRSVDAAAANAAFSSAVASRPLAIVVAGDAAVVGDDLRALGLPVVPVDSEGRPLPGLSGQEEP